MNIIQSVLIGIIVSLLGFSSVQYFKNRSKDTLIAKKDITIMNLGTAVKEYDKLIEIVPFTALNKQNGVRANEDINKTKHNTNLIIGNKWM